MMLKAKTASRTRTGRLFTVTDLTGDKSLELLRDWRGVEFGGATGKFTPVYD